MADSPVLSATTGDVSGAVNGRDRRNTVRSRQRMNQPSEAVNQWMPLTHQMGAVHPDRATTIGTPMAPCPRSTVVQNNFQGGPSGTGHDDDFLNVPHHELPGLVSLRHSNRPTAYFRHANSWKKATSLCRYFLVQIPINLSFLANGKCCYGNVEMMNSKSTHLIK